MIKQPASMWGSQPSNPGPSEPGSRVPSHSIEEHSFEAPFSVVMFSVSPRPWPWLAEKGKAHESSNRSIKTLRLIQSGR